MDYRSIVTQFQLEISISCAADTMTIGADETLTCKRTRTRASDKASH